MQNFMLKCSNLASNLKKNHHLIEKTAKIDFDDFSIVKVCVTVLKWVFIYLTGYGTYNKRQCPLKLDH